MGLSRSLVLLISHLKYSRCHHKNESFIEKTDNLRDHIGSILRRFESPQHMVSGENKNSKNLRSHSQTMIEALRTE